MRMPILGGPLLVAAILATVASGCGTAAIIEEPTPTSTLALTDQRDVDVYTAVLRHHLTDRTSGGPLYLVAQAVPDAADPMRTTTAGGGTPIPPQVRDRLVRELADLGTIGFVPNADAVISLREGCPAVNGGGLVVTLAPVPATGDWLEIGLGDFRACLDARWQTYVVVHQTGVWTVQGITDPVSIS